MLANISVKSQTANILGYVDNSLCCNYSHLSCSMKAAIGNTGE